MSKRNKRRVVATETKIDRNINPGEKVPVNVSEVKVKMKVVPMGAEPLILQGLSNEQSGMFMEWYKGNLNKVLEVPMGQTKLMLDRDKTAYLVFEIQSDEQEGSESDDESNR